MSWPAEAERWLANRPGIERDHALARHTSFNIGGPADYFAEAATATGLRDLVVGARRRGIPCRVLGAGTNLLISDAGVDGLVVRCTTRGHRIAGDLVRAEAGLKMMRLARIAAAADLTGFEFAIGVPGSAGGAVYQNAGCWGTELISVLVRAEGFGPEGEERQWEVGELGLGYRTSAFREGRLRDSTVTAAWIRLQPGDGAESRRSMARLTRERNASQPIRTLNCGSVFRNPAGDSAGRLIEAAGLKGARAGAAQISDQHANFIVNQGGASSADVDRLIEMARERVRERFGVELEPEVERWGRP